MTRKSDIKQVGGEAPQPLRAERSPLKPKHAMSDACVALAQSCVRQWQGNVSGAAQVGAEEAVEFIHQARVALRRLRSVLKVFTPALSAEFADVWQPRLRDNADRFGPARDLDVLWTELLDSVVPDGLLGSQAFRNLLATADTERQAAHASARKAIDPDEQGRMVAAFTTDLLQLQRNAFGNDIELASFAKQRLARVRTRARERFVGARACARATAPTSYWREGTALHA